MGKDVRVMILLVIMSLGLNYLYISNRNSNAEIVFSDNIERVDYLEDSSSQETIENIIENTSENISENISEKTPQNITTTIDTTQEATVIVQDNNNNNKININTATLKELITLPSIGEALGQRIIDYRTNIAYFGDIIEIINVSGIGEKTFENIKDFISID
ncbi:MAG: helix-hairpin-helix domain-containing protein [bacterium]